jgi:hypothetical protein
MNANERADAIIQDILTNHLPRVVEGLKAGYVDENQVLVIYDHAVRARILKEFAEAQPALEEMDNLGKLNRELEAEWRLEKQIEQQGETKGDIPPMPETTLVNVPAPGIPCGILKQVEVPAALKEEIEQVLAVIIGINTTNGQRSYVASMDGGFPVHTLDRGSAWVQRVDAAKALAVEWTRRYADMTFSVERVAEINLKPAVPDKNYGYVLDKEPYAGKQRVVTGAQLRTLLPEAKKGYAIFQEAEGTLPDINIKDDTTVNLDANSVVFYSVPPATFGAPQKLTCVCGGEIKEMPTSIEALLKCSACERVYMDEGDVAHVRHTERMTGQKCNDATYWTTGTLANGDTPVPMETQININSDKVTIKARNGRFTLSYEEIVRIVVNQINKERGRTPFNGPDSDLPMLTCTYRHRVPFEQLPGERDGSLYKGKSVECTPGMVINCMDTSNA